MTSGLPLRKKTTHCVVHITATRPAAAKRGDVVASIDRYHRDELGWKWGIGYNEVITPDGKLHEGRGADAIGAHVSGWNSVSYGVALVGGVDDAGTLDMSTITDDQWETLQRRLRELTLGPSARYPGAVVCGHRSLYDDRDGDGIIEEHEWGKTCPGFNAMVWAAENGLPAAQIREGDASVRPVGPDSRLAYLQRLLIRAGHDAGPPDGIWGPRTEAAAAAYQRANGLAITGALDPLTVQSLRRRFEDPGEAGPARPPIDGLDKGAGASSSVRAIGFTQFFGQIVLWFTGLPIAVKIGMAVVLAALAVWGVRERLRYARAARALARGDRLPEPDPDVLDAINAQTMALWRRFAHAPEAKEA